LTGTSKLYNFLETSEILLENGGELYNFLETSEILLENGGELYSFSKHEDISATDSRLGDFECVFFSS
jgi:hypothetical protein